MCSWSKSWDANPTTPDKYKEKGFEGTWANSPAPTIAPTSSNPSVTLPHAKAGAEITITNKGDVPLTIYPPSSQSSNPWDALDQDALLMLHKAKQDALSALKTEELELRKYIVVRAFPNKQEGMNTLELGSGYELKATVKYNYKLADNDVVEKTLDEIAKVGNEGPFVADRLVSWTPNFLKTEYTKLQEEADKGNESAKTILKLTENMLTITDAAPTLVIKEPKKK